MTHVHVRENLDAGITVIAFSDDEELDWDNFSLEDVKAVRVIINQEEQPER